MGFDYDSPGSAFGTKDTSAPCRGTYRHDDPGKEIALDLQGRKHVKRSDHADGVYWLQQYTHSSLVVFPVPGAASANTFRKFLEVYLPCSLITDEYGQVMPLEQLSDDYLPILQVQIWQNRTNNDANTASQAGALGRLVKKCGPFAQHRSTTMLEPTSEDLATEQVRAAARYVRFIVELLKCESTDYYLMSCTDHVSKSHLYPSQGC
jgi:hypothetical protein